MHNTKSTLRRFSQLSANSWGRQWHHFTHTEQGLTLTELLMALVTSGILLSAMVSSFISQQQTYKIQEQKSEATLIGRAALDMIARDIRLSGYGVPTSNLDQWIDWVYDENGNRMEFTEPIHLTQRDNAPDILILIGCFDAPIARLRRETAVGDETLSLRYYNRNQTFNTTKRKTFYLGRNEHGTVTTAPKRARKRSGITIDTDPTVPANQGLEWAYRKGTEMLELLKVVTYAIKIDKVNYDRPTPILTRNENTGGGAQPLAEQVEGLKVIRNAATLTVTLTVRTAQSDPRYRHPTKGDGYRRLTFTSQVTPRGFQL